MPSDPGRLSAFAERLVAVALALAVALFAAPAAAHEVGLSRGEYRVEGATVIADMVFARREMASLVPGLDADGDERLGAGEVAAGKAAIEKALVGAIVVQADGKRCPGTLVDAQLFEEDGLRVRAEFHCEAVPGTLRFDFPVLDELALGHRHIASAEIGGKNLDAVLSRKSRSFDVVVGGRGTSAPRRLSALDMIRLGIEHILTGYDHLVFLFGLVLVGGKWRSLLLVITAFTLGHSVTLGVAALGIYTPSPRIIEPAIALSIAYVGIENYFVADAAKRWRITLPFGLIHGFGFAGALREVALPKADIPLALVSFNVGVEIGQLAIMAVVLPVVLYARKQEWFKNAGVKTLSAAITVAGVVWFVTRVANV